MYGIVVCISCERKRIADLGSERSECPYCGKISKTSELSILFSDKSQSTVRKTFENIDSPKYAEPEKKRTDDPDPMSTLMYRYEHVTDTREKLMVLADGLTKIRGSFNEGDVEELFPGKGEKMIMMMRSGDIIIESSDGKYRAM